MPNIASNKQLLKIFGLLSLVCFVFYANIIRNLYSEDDYRVTSDYKRHNTAVEKGFGGIAEIFASRYTTAKIDNDYETVYGYRPIARATFAVEWALWGQNPHLGHLINIIIYCITACLLFYLLSKTIFRNKDSIYPLITTLIFIAHPIHTEVVASLKNREEQLSFLFGLLFIATIWRYFTTRNLALPWLAVAILILSLLSKESGIVYLAVAPVFVFFFHPDAKRTLTNPEKINFIAIILAAVAVNLILSTLIVLVPIAVIFAVLAWYNKGSYSALLTYGLLVALIMINTLMLPNMLLEQSNHDTYFWANPLYGKATLSEHIGFILSTILYYIKLLFVPHPLAFYYGYNVVPLTGIFSPKALLAIAILVGLGYWSYKEFNRNKLVPFTIIFFFVTLAPFTNILPVRGIVADRLIYVSSLSFCIGLALLLINLKSWFGSKNNRVIYIATAIIGIVYFVKVFNRNQDWYSYYDLYSHDAKNFPNSAKANSMFATLLVDNIPAEQNPKKRNEMVRLAIKHYEQSLKVYPTYAESLNALGFIYFQLGQPDRALQYHLKNLRNNPDYTPVYVNVAGCYHRMGNVPVAKHYYNIALQKDTLSPVVYLNFADIYIAENKKDSAMYVYNLAIKRKVKDAELDASIKKLQQEQ